MIEAPLYNSQGGKVGTKELNPALFGVSVSPGLLHQVVTSMMANLRRPIASTKTRAEVRGGGRKPWRQKGTGRARHGSIRSPLWRKGGVTFGPRPDRVFEQKINKKTKQKAFRMALSDKAKGGHIFLLENLEIGEKTKNMFQVLLKLPVKTEKGIASTLVALGSKEYNKRRVIRNIPKVSALDLKSVNVLDVVRNRNMLMTLEGLKEFEKQYAHV